MQLSELFDTALSAVHGRQAELARGVGRSEPTVSRWFSGAVKPDYESCLRLARISKVPPHIWLEAAGHDPTLMPQTAAPSSIQSELELRLARLAMILSRYPRAFWLAVIEACELMASIGDAIPPDLTETLSSVRASAKTVVSDQTQPELRGTDEGDPKLANYKGPLQAFAAILTPQRTMALTG